MSVASHNQAIRHYLILKYPGGHFDFPKGHVEPGETEQETAKRELEEETGITQVNIYPDFREQMNYKYMKKGQSSHKEVIYFLGETETEDIQLSFEHKDFHWLPYEAALEKLTFENAKRLLRMSEQHLLSQGT